MLLPSTPPRQVRADLHEDLVVSPGGGRNSNGGHAKKACRSVAAAPGALGPASPGERARSRSRGRPRIAPSRPDDFPRDRCRLVRLRTRERSFLRFPHRVEGAAGAPGLASLSGDLARPAIRSAARAASGLRTPRVTGPGASTRVSTASAPPGRGTKRHKLRHVTQDEILIVRRSGTNADLRHRGIRHQVTAPARWCELCRDRSNTRPDRFFPTASFDPAGKTPPALSFHS